MCEPGSIVLGAVGAVREIDNCSNRGYLLAGVKDMLQITNRYILLSSDRVFKNRVRIC